MFQNGIFPDTAWIENCGQMKVDTAMEHFWKMLVSSTYKIPALRNAGRQRRCHHSSAQNTEKQQSPTNSGALLRKSHFSDPGQFFHVWMRNWTKMTVENGQSWLNWVFLRSAIWTSLVHVFEVATCCKVNVAEQRRRQAALAEYARKVWNVETNIACKMLHCSDVSVHF